MKELLENSLVQSLIELSFKEDIGSGDVTSLSCIDTHAQGKAHIVAKDAGVLAGVELAKFIFSKIDDSLLVKTHFADGAILQSGDCVLEVEGSSISILTAERTVLNFMQRLSGIATLTARYVQELKGTHTKILDTRKTTPGMRLLEKWAVKIGGGENHRIGLYDMVLIKDNHIDFAGGISQAIDRCHQYLETHKLSLDIEIEVRNLQEVEEVLKKGGVTRIMLDNFTTDAMQHAVKLIHNRFETEASGGITLERLREIALTGVTYISSGALTHSVKSLDLSMRVSK